MTAIRIMSGMVMLALFSGCASIQQPTGSKGPKLVSSGQMTEHGQYAEVGVQFTSVGDMVALFSPSRWESPVATGGSLSWINPVAWGDDAVRTGRILLGQAVIAGGVFAAVEASDSNDGGSSPSGSPPPPPDGEPPPGGGGGTPPPVP